MIRGTYMDRSTEKEGREDENGRNISLVSLMVEIVGSASTPARTYTHMHRHSR